MPSRGAEGNMGAVGAAPNTGPPINPVALPPSSPLSLKPVLVPSLDIELSLIGFNGDKSPWLVSKVCRTFALSGSLDQAWCELNRDGIKLERNVIDRIVTQSGYELLTVRERLLSELAAWTCHHRASFR